jgi:hypothetical protein
MLRIYGAVLLGMNPRRNRSTNPFVVYLLGFKMITRSGFAISTFLFILRFYIDECFAKWVFGTFKKREDGFSLFPSMNWYMYLPVGSRAVNHKSVNIFVR